VVGRISSDDLRTLVISDLHLGSRLRYDVLTRPEPLRHLLAALDDVERLVLLGDIVELRQGRAQRALAIAEPVLRALGARLGPEGSVLLVPGNHDLPLVRHWVRAQGRALTPASAVPLDASPALARLASWLAPARLSVSYPGAWLGSGVWATHGHYLDQHLLPESSYGFARGLLGRLPRGGALPIDYEHLRRPSLSRTARFWPRPAARTLNDLAELVRARTMPRVTRHLLRRRFAPLTSMLLERQMRHAAIPALARVAHRLGVDAEWVIFGHVHRVGPLPGEDPAAWRGPGGHPRVANTGAWLYEPLLVSRAVPPHPYWPGGAVLLEPGREPLAIGLLDDLGVSELQ
jgi:UDP-2,3-diacylglucosamine pyrophosphatase LpxH